FWPSGFSTDLLKSKSAPCSSPIFLGAGGGGGGGGGGAGGTFSGAQTRWPMTAPSAPPPTMPPAIAPPRVELEGSSIALLETTPPVMPPAVAPRMPPPIAQPSHSRSFINAQQLSVPASSSPIATRLKAGMCPSPEACVAPCASPKPVRRSRRRQNRGGTGSRRPPRRSRGGAERRKPANSPRQRVDRARLFVRKSTRRRRRRNFAVTRVIFRRV